MATRYAFNAKMYDAYEYDAQQIGEHLAALIDEKQEHVTPEEIVADARKHTSPLRDIFTWDDALAADKWRKREARNLTRSLVLAQGKKATRTRAFCYVHHPQHGGRKVLMTTRSALARPEFREQVIEQAIHALTRSLTYWGQAYGGHKGLKALAKDVAELRKRVERELGFVVAA